MIRLIVRDGETVHELEPLPEAAVTTLVGLWGPPGRMWWGSIANMLYESYVRTGRSALEGFLLGIAWRMAWQRQLEVGGALA